MTLWLDSLIVLLFILAVKLGTQWWLVARSPDWTRADGDPRAVGSLISISSYA